MKVSFKLDNFVKNHVTIFKIFFPEDWLRHLSIITGLEVSKL